MSVSNIMTAVERRASFGLASIYGLRMLGLFIILPVFALWAQGRPAVIGQSVIYVDDEAANSVIAQEIERQSADMPHRDPRPNRAPG